MRDWATAFASATFVVASLSALPAAVGEETPPVPAGRLLVAHTPDVTTEAPNVWSVRADGSDLVELSAPGSPQSRQYSRPDATADGTEVVFHASSIQTRADVMLLNPETGGQVNLTNTPSVGELYPAISPDGRYVAYQVFRYTEETFTSEGVHILDRETGDVVTSPETWQASDLAWSPDGTELLIAGTTETRDLRLYTLDPTTGEYSGQLSEGRIIRAEYSPDGTTLAVIGWNPELTHFGLWRLGPGGSFDELLQESNKMSGLAWSPDGTEIAYDEQRAVHRVNANGTGEPTQVLTAPTGLAHIGDWISDPSNAYYADGDNDGYGAGAASHATSQPNGYVANSSDCDDSASSVNPGATETYNQVDDDCDGSTDEGLLRPGAPAIGSASSGAKGKPINATARWSTPTSDGGSAVTGYVVQAQKLNSSGKVVARTNKAAGPSATSLVIKLTSARYKFRVKAANAVGQGAWSSNSNIVRAR